MLALLIALAIATVVAFVAIGRTRAAELRLRLVEERERESLAVAAAFADASRHSPDAVLNALDRALRAIDPAIDVTLIYLPRASELACFVANGGRAEAFYGSALDRDGDGLPALAARAGHRVRHHGNGIVPGDRDAIAMPLCDGESVLVVIYLATTQRSLGDVEGLVRLAMRAVPVYALALERAKHVRDATYDGLTGLLAARPFRERLREAIAAADPRAHCSVWFVDTDSFKTVNDTLGHATGDAVLVQMAALLRTHAGEAAVARNGGDEFCALLPGATKSVAIERAEAFRAAVAGYDFGIGRSLGASVGVAAYPLDAASANDLLECADAAMYHSKRSGRNRVSFALAPGAFAVYERNG